MSTIVSQLVDALVGAGVKVVFGFPGETSLPLYIELQGRTEEVRHVLARCPRGAGYMADAYARVTGGLAVADSPGGIGSPFVAPCAHEANNSSVPLLFIASAESTTLDGKWTTSTCDQQGMFGALTKATFRVAKAESFADTVRETLETLTSSPLGPVFLEVPTNLFGKPAPSSVELRQAAADVVARRSSGPPISSEQIASLVQPLERFSSIAVILGGGCYADGAPELVRRLIDRTGWPVATTLNGKGCLSEGHARSLGVCGAKGLMSANDYLVGVDCLIALGTKLGDKSLNYGQLAHDRQHVIHVNNNAAHLSQVSEQYTPICASVRDFLRVLLELDLPAMAHLPVAPQTAFWRPTPTAALCAYLTEQLPARSVLVAEASVARGWAGAAVKFDKAEQRLLTPAGSGSLSYALPAAIGAQIARPQARVVGLGGDGGMLMALHDMETARRMNLPIVFFLLNNNRLGLIDQHAEMIHGGKAVSDAFVDLDWEHIASAFDWRYIRADSIAALRAGLPVLDEVGAPTLVDYKVPANELAPDFLLTLRRKGINV